MATKLSKRTREEIATLADDFGFADLGLLLWNDRKDERQFLRTIGTQAHIVSKFPTVETLAQCSELCHELLRIAGRSESSATRRAIQRDLDQMDWFPTEQNILPEQILELFGEKVEMVEWFESLTHDELMETRNIAAVRFAGWEPDFDAKSGAIRTEEMDDPSNHRTFKDANELLAIVAQAELTRRKSELHTCKW